MKTRTFIDSVSVEVKAGKGGDGCSSFRREACVPEGGPDGGDGGIGGSVIIRADHDTDSLIALYYAPRAWAEDGVNGRGQKMHGRNGKDLIVKVPCGTEVYDLQTGAFLAEVLEDGQEALIAQGGRGGWGNVHFKSSVNQAPERAIPGLPGMEFRARFELKTIADAGLLGFPNAGKSSLLAALSAAKPKVGSYPFTTLNPIVGTVIYPDNVQLRIADVPGIIEGAANGVGLGTAFLKHIARARILLYVIDMAGTDNRNPWDDYRILTSEIEQYNPELLGRPFLVLANKMDEDAALENLPRFIKETGVNPIQVSTISDDFPGLLELRQKLRDLIVVTAPAVVEAEAKPPVPVPVPVEEAAAEDDVGLITPEQLAKASFIVQDPKSSRKKGRK